VRKPLCGGDHMTDNMRVKILEVLRRNRNNSQTTRNEGDSLETITIDAKKIDLPVLSGVVDQ
jgi:hypothetical protein